jgi:hypothetical protein
MKIAFLYPRISHYREDFFLFFKKNYNCDIFVYEDTKENKNNNFEISNIETIKLKSKLLFKKIRIFSILPFFSNHYDCIILIAEMKVLPTWFILIIARILKKNVILWGHGISIHSYLSEEIKLNPIRVMYHKLATNVWLYTDKEVVLWEKHIKKNRLVSLNNTIDIKKILSLPKLNSNTLKNKYNIKTEVNLIYCARFSMYERRTDLLIEIIERLDRKKYGFLIIGDGPIKPNFSKYSNVIDFGSVYDENIKNELFQIADLYIQPAWIGLSCNEALAYGKPVLTFKRSENIKQCVEYTYLNEFNSFIANNMEEMITFITSLNQERISFYKKNAKNYAKDNLLLDLMINRANHSLKNCLTNQKVGK